MSGESLNDLTRIHIKEPDNLVITSSHDMTTARVPFDGVDVSTMAEVEAYQAATGVSAVICGVEGCGVGACGRSWGV